MRRSSSPLGVVLVLALVAAGCASSTGARPLAFPRAPLPPTAGPFAAAAPLRQAIAETALGLRGVRYQLGGTDPAGGFDCSGLVQYVFARYDVSLPRTVAEQYDAEPAVDDKSPEVGDLLFYAIDSSSPTHVGIVINRTEFVHAPGTGRVVRVERFDTPYWRSRFKGIRRPL
jgi:cell wall-associated NlpC family hydrolase